MTIDNKNLIQQAAEKAKAPAVRSTAARMNDIVNAPATQKLLQNALKENAGAYAASIIDLYNTDRALQGCDPTKVMAEVLKAVSLKLPINKQLGFAYIIPYSGVPTFILGYKGMLQLCMRTGAYRYINAGPVYEGELASEDKLRGDIDLSGERTGDKVVGYFAYIETLNGFAKAIYWPMSKVVSHAKKYSKNFGGKIWQDNFDEMATKTVLRYLLSHWGVMSVDMANAIASDENAEAADAAIDAQPPIYVNDNTDPDTGEILPVQDVKGA